MRTPSCPESIQLPLSFGYERFQTSVGCLTLPYHHEAPPRPHGKVRIQRPSKLKEQGNTTKGRGGRPRQAMDQAKTGAIPNGVAPVVSIALKVRSGQAADSAATKLRTISMWAETNLEFIDRASSMMLRMFFASLHKSINSSKRACRHFEILPLYFSIVRRQKSMSCATRGSLLVIIELFIS